MASTQLRGQMLRREETAAAALYLASDESAMITGPTHDRWWMERRKAIHTLAQFGVVGF